ncbi:MAG: hypothetical protein FWC70_04190 [Defluviitaleaceae bacterium]|nr:hypothetical protein [Defluviitaleaceae bacterium]
MKKITLLLMFAVGLVLLGCSNNVDWLSPMISIEKDTHTVSLWSGAYNLHRNETMEYVFRTGDDFNDVAITSDALIAGGAVPATLRVAYDGDGQYLVRLVAFAYNFFDHGRPIRINAHAAAPNPQDILILWQNPENGHWFSMIQNGIGREAVTLGQHHNELVSMRHGGEVYTFLLNSETAATLSELTVYIIAVTAPTQEEDYERSGYSVLFTLELPDVDNHFHSWEILAACGTMFLVDGE